MEYPINEDVFIAEYLEKVGSQSEIDIQLAKALVHALNAAYYQGIEAGKELV